MDSPVLVRPAGNGPKGESGTTVKKLENRRVSKARRGFDTTSIGRGSAPHGGGGSLIRLAEEHGQDSLLKGFAYSIQGRYGKNWE